MGTLTEASPGSVEDRGKSNSASGSPEEAFSPSLPGI